MSRSPYAPLFPSDPARPKALSVAELVARLQSQVQLLGEVVVEGEVSGLRPATTGGHLYFALKDPRTEASIACVMFRREVAIGQGERLSDGARVVLRVAPEVYTARGQLQLIVSKVESTAEGDLAAKREARKRKLAAEGLFEPARKRALPLDPRLIGVVTSAGGVAFRDIIKVARARGNVPLLLVHAQVQGDGAAEDLCRALRLVGRVAEVDVIILGRGGGSAEDLAAFDDEDLARAIAACPKPVVAAVGHEIDWSIADLVADRRAATPSHAAEMVVPDFGARRRQLREVALRLIGAVQASQGRFRERLSHLDKRVSAPERALRQHAQHLDELEDRLHAELEGAVKRGEQALSNLEQRLAARDPRRVLAASALALEPLPHRLLAAMEKQLASRDHAIVRAAERLDAISPLAVLGRGYAIALRDGAAVRRASEVSVGEVLDLRLHEGSVEVSVRKVTP